MGIRSTSSLFRDFADEMSEPGFSINSHGGFGATVRLGVGHCQRRLDYPYLLTNVIDFAINKRHASP